MTEPVARGLLAAAIVGVPVLVAWLRGRPRRLRIGDFPADLGPFPGVYLFSSRTCPTCPPARELVQHVCGSTVRELTWPKDTVAFHKVGVGVVPASFVVGAKGRIVESFEGIPEERRLRRALAKAGLPVTGQAPGAGGG